MAKGLSIRGAEAAIRRSGLPSSVAILQPSDYQVELLFSMGL
jgi:hypothetical protein